MEALSASILVWFAIAIICCIQSLICCTDTWTPANALFISSKLLLTSFELFFNSSTFFCASPTESTISFFTPSKLVAIWPTSANTDDNSCTWSFNLSFSLVASTNAFCISAISSSDSTSLSASCFWYSIILSATCMTGCISKVSSCADITFSFCVFNFLPNI